MISVECKKCKGILEELGAILLVPVPDEKGMTKKEHLCRLCYDKIFKEDK